MTEIGEKGKVPEVPLNRTILNVLKSVDTQLHARNDKSPLRITSNAITLQNGATALATISPSDILVAGDDFQDKIVSSELADSNSLLGEKFTNFLDVVSSRIVRLNHLGLSYFCKDINQEVTRLKALAEQSGIPLYKEPSTDTAQSWLFLGDVNNWEEPLFEFVLNEGTAAALNRKPHFQIDIDTSLSLDEIRTLTDQHLREGFLHWQLDIPNFGTVLTMGTLGEVNGTEIALGIGTNKRGTEYHRKNELELV